MPWSNQGRVDEIMTERMTMRDLRRAIEKVVSEKPGASTLSTASANTGACMMYRGGKTKDVCAMTTRKECSLLDVELQKKGGHTVFYLGKNCSS